MMTKDEAKKNRHRMLVLYLLVGLVGTLFLIRSNILSTQVDDEQHRFERVTYDNCKRQNLANRGVNDLIEQARMNLRNSNSLTEKQKRAANAAYDKIDEPIVDCDVLAHGRR